MDSKKFVLLIAVLTAAVCVLTVVYNFASMPAYGGGDVSAVALYASSDDAAEPSGASAALPDGSSPSAAVGKSGAQPSSGGLTSSEDRVSSGQPTSSGRPASSGRSSAVSRRTSSTAPSKVTAANPVNLNTATLAELETVPGIGAARAQDIIDYRSAHGPFKSIDGLDAVKGFGAKMIAKVKPYLTI